MSTPQFRCSYVATRIWLESNFMFNHLAQNWSDVTIAGAVLGSIVSVLALQTNRLESYESEKYFLLSAFACVILGGMLLKLYYEPRSLRVLINPITPVVLLWLISLVLSSLTSISLVQSIFGSHARSHGILTWVIYALLFAGAVVTAQTLRPFAIPTLVSVSIPLCAWALVRQGSDTEFLRNGSTTGNAVFLSSWIIIVLPILAYELVGQYRSWRSTTRVSSLGSLALISLSIVILVITLLSARSRGAVVALASILSFSLMLRLALQKKQKLLLLSLLFLFGVLLFIIMIGQPHNAATTSGLNRLLVFEDPFRADTWSHQVSAILYRPRLVDLCGTPDRFAASRSLVGFGPETLEFLGPQTFDGFSVDRFHNLIYDVRFTNGILGVLAWAVLYLALISWPLRRMNFLRKQQAGLWIITHIVSMVAAIYIMKWMLPEPIQYASLPLGLVSGSLAHIISWIYIKPRPRRLDTFCRHHLVLLTIVLVHVIDLQFSFVQMASESLWWVLIGVYIGLSYRGKLDEQLTTGVKPSHWQFATAATGLVVIHSWINFPHFSVLFVEDKWNGFALLMLFVVVFVGTIGAFSSQRNGTIFGVGRMLVIVGIFLTVIALKFGTQAVSADWMHQALFDAEPELLPYSLILMSVSGVVVILGILVSFGRLAGAVRNPVVGGVPVIVLVALVGGIYIYTSNYSSVAAHRLATVLASDDERYLDEATTLAFQESLSYKVPSFRLYMDWIYLDLRRYSTPGYDFDNRQLVKNLQQLHRHYPFHNITSEWDRFASAADDNKLYYREYICYPDQEF
jgi:hypothetical protein